MGDEMDDLLDGVQGRWQTTEGDFLVVEADQVWFLGDTNVYGLLNVDKQDDRVVISFSTTGGPDQPSETTTGGFGDSEGTIIWADGDTWKKLQPGETPASANMKSTTGKTVGRISNQCTVDLDEEGQERRWTKNGQLGSGEQAQQ